MFGKKIINASRKLKERLHLGTNFFLNGCLDIGTEGVCHEMGDDCV